MYLKNFFIHYIDRLTKGEEIFVFCFYALKYIQEEDFSVISHR